MNAEINPYLPANRQEAGSEEEKTGLILKVAKESGLVHSGFDEDGEPQFVGSEQQFEQFEKLLAEYE
jgi:hypothetical protein